MAQRERGAYFAKYYARTKLEQRQKYLERIRKETPEEREARLEKKRRYRRENREYREYCRAYDKAYRALHRERYKELKRAWTKANWAMIKTTPRYLNRLTPKAHKRRRQERYKREYGELWEAKEVIQDILRKRYQKPVEEKDNEDRKLAKRSKPKKQTMGNTTTRKKRKDNARTSLLSRKNRKRNT